VILVDTSIWIDHLRRGDELLQDLLDKSEVLAHPFIIGELALGSWRGRDVALRRLGRLPRATIARDYEVMRLIEQYTLFGQGIGYVDAHLLAATRLTTPETQLWTRDKRLSAVAERLSLAARLTH
jgi:predicted nucleic acid-binding protein